MNIPAQSDDRCADCGGCCDGAWSVEASPADQLREPRIVAHAVETLPDGYVVIGHPGRSCPFLSDRKRCRIYDTRPDGCRRTMLAGAECNDSRRRKGLELIQLTPPSGG